jgi:hypothetical protein
VGVTQGPKKLQIKNNNKNEKIDKGKGENERGKPAIFLICYLANARCWISTVHIKYCCLVITDSFKEL